MSKHVLDQLSEYLDDRLAKAQRDDIRAHLRACPRCHDEFQALSDQRELLKASPVLTPPESFYRGVLNRIEQPAPGKPATAGGSWWGIPLKAMATACLLMIIVLVTRDKKPEITPFTEMMDVKPLKPPAAFEAANQKKLDKDASEVVSVGGRIAAARDGEESSSAERSEAPRRLSKVFDEKNEAAPKFKRTTTSEREGATANAVEGHGAAKLAEKSAAFGMEDNAAPAPVAAPAALASRSDITLQARALSGPASQASFNDQVTAQTSRGGLVPGASGGSVEEAVRWKGYSSGVEAPRQLVLRSNEEWITLWNEHNRGARPTVDFSRYSVIAVFAGNQPTAGRTVDIERIMFNADQIVVQYRETAPGGGMMTAQMITQPYEMRIIPRTGLPVRFEKLP